MSGSRTRHRPRSRRPDVVQKPRGTFHPRVQKVGPEHFGIVAVDCAKARSKWMLAGFYGNVLLPPAVVVEHTREGFESALPGYAACLATFWEHPAAMTLALQLGGAEALSRAGVM